jgi:aminomethyltransferase
LVKKHSRLGKLDNLKTTPLYEVHKSLGARMVPFGGWEMPVQYTSIINEHMATRSSAGLFDVSHMGEIFLEGKKEVLLTFLEKLTCNNVEPMQNFQVQYNAVLNEAGGLVDDITLYKFSDEKYMICSNASNFEKVFEHLNTFNDSQLNITNQSKDYHQIAIQGPKADSIFSNFLKQSFIELEYYHFTIVKYKNEDLIVSRTGYTGEDGFEIYSSNEIGVKLWSELLEFGKKEGLIPVGLGARDTLRLESKYALYGHELSMEKTPVESGIGWIVKEKSKPFLAYEKIITEKKNKSKYSTVAVKLVDSGILRENYLVFDKNGIEIGITTSGGYSPCLKESIGLVHILSENSADSETVFIEIRKEKKKAIIHKNSFVKGSVRKK